MSFRFCAEHLHRYVTPYCRICVGEMFIRCKLEEAELDELYAAHPTSEEHRQLERRDRCNDTAYHLALLRQAENQRWEEQSNWPSTTVENRDPQHMHMEQVRFRFPFRFRI